MASWFRRKTFGYGWTPASWEGWVATLALALCCFGINDPEWLSLDKSERIVCTLAVIAGFIALCLATTGRGTDP